MLAISLRIIPSAMALLCVKIESISICLQNGRFEYAWIIRHQDPLQCGVGAVLRWLLWQHEFMVDKDSPPECGKFPDMNSRRSW